MNKHVGRLFILDLRLLTLSELWKTKHARSVRVFGVSGWELDPSGGGRPKNHCQNISR